ncbi:uncharacterized protein SAPINGB_P001497 [Magnusiomyces paraingens]|uniref:Uncharacterized protein n=1 Tax=Magnusiomyces paraingens TaxID=2606893 RepID=A0A5E8B612_9ASCO|nr:uncharacterized protein SAPINGB_P001497 [Saprochaete ingens]VVT47007.1 unnamed protein product [Saprochaete ingens]
MPSQESPYKFLTMLVVGLGTYALYKFLKTQGNSPADISNATKTTQKTATREDLIAKFGEKPEIVKDEDTGEYFVQDPKNPDNITPITPEEIKILNQYPRDAQQPPTAPHPQQQQQQPQQQEQPAAVQPPAFVGDGVIGPEDFEDFQEDIEDPELEALNRGLADEEEFRQHQQQAGFGAGGAGPGPATANARAASGTKIIGTKKAKSLERKDQKRAFNEYVREMSLMQKAENEEQERMYGDLIQMERDERKQRNEEAENERKERLRKQKEMEEDALAAKEYSRKRLQELEPGQYHAILSPDEIGIAHGLADAFVVNEDSFVVKLSQDDIEAFAKALQEKGTVSYEEMADILTQIKA